MHSQIIRRFIYVLIFIVIVYSVYFVFTDIKENIRTISRFNWWLFPPALLLVFINFTLREFKWDWFRRAAKIDVPRKGSFAIFFSGYSMCISPGRIGELIKPFLFKDLFGVWYRRTIPLVFCERLTDLLGMIVLCILTIGYYLQSVTNKEMAEEGALTNTHIVLFLIASIVFLGVAIGLIRWRKFVAGTFYTIRHRFPAGFAHKIEPIVERLENLYDSTYPLLTARNLVLMTLFAAFSWLFECLGAWVICHGLGIADTVNLIHIVFLFCIASIIGGLFFFLPGGVGGFEPTMHWLLRLLDIGSAAAAAFVFLTRVATLFFGAAVGFVALALTSRAHHKNIWTELDHLQKDLDHDVEQPTEESSEEALENPSTNIGKANS